MAAFHGCSMRASVAHNQMVCICPTCSWMSELMDLAQCRTRMLRAFAVDPDGTSLLVTRYVCPLPLPPPLKAAAAAPTPLPGVSATEAVMLKVRAPLSACDLRVLPAWLRPGISECSGHRALFVM